ncbi:MAG: TolC family protein [Verrucomicrobiota bacterium]
MNARFSALSLFLGFLAPAFGETSPSSTAPNPTVSIGDLVRETVSHNPELRFYEAEITAARAQRTSAGLPQNPVLSSDVGPMRTRDRDGTLAGEGVAWSVSVLQPIEWPGRIGLRKAIANRDIELAELGLARFRANVAARTRVLAFGLFAARERATAAAEVAARLRELRDVLVQRDPAGITPLLETRLMEALELTAQRQASEAALAVDRVLLELATLQGLASPEPVVLSPVQLEFRPAPEVHQLQTLARTNHFELRVRAVELEQQGFRVDLARNERWPDISLGPQIWQQNAADNQRSVGVGLSFPLPLWNRNTSRIEAARAREIQARTLLAAAQRETALQVSQSATTYTTKVREMNRWRPDTVAHFRESAELADRHYRLGAVPAATYVELQRQYLDAVTALLETRQEALEAAQQLELLTGLPEPLVVTKATETQP